LCWDKPLKTLRELAASPLRRQIAETLRRARKLPPGPHRNDLRQLASGLLLLHKTSVGGKSSEPRSVYEFQQQRLTSCL